MQSYGRPLMGVTRVQTSLIIILLAFLSFYSRLAFLNREVLDWDETTFMLMAQDVLRGNLPYVHIFDNKPPGMFFILAAAMKLFGQSLVTVRLCGGMFLFLTAVTVFAIARRFVDEITAGITSGAMIAATTVDFGLHTSTELAAIFFLTVGLALMLFRGEALWSAFCVGLCLSCATLIRTNVAFIALAIGILYVAGSLSAFLRLHRWGPLAYGLGGLLPLGILMMMYAASGYFDLFIVSTVKVPLSYSSTQMSIGDALYYTFWNIYHASRASGGFGFFVAAAIIGTAATIGSTLLNRDPPGIPSQQKRDIVIITTVFLANTFSLLVGGAAYQHYLLMLYPFAAIATAMGMRRDLFVGIRGLSCVLALTAIAMALRVDTRAMISLARSDTTQSSYPIWRIANAIASDRRPGDEVWALQHHLVLFYLNEPPVSPLATHPKNLFREAIKKPLIEAGYIPENEFDRIIATTPRYIVYESGGIPDYVQGENRHALTKLIEEKYIPWINLNNISVFRRKF